MPLPEDVALDIHVALRMADSLFRSPTAAAAKAAKRLAATSALNLWLKEFDSSIRCLVALRDRIDSATEGLSKAIALSMQRRHLIFAMHEAKALFFEVQSSPEASVDNEFKAFPVEIRHGKPIRVPRHLYSEAPVSLCVQHVVDACLCVELVKPKYLRRTLSPDISRLQTLFNLGINASTEATHPATGLCFLCEKPNVAGMCRDAQVFTCTFCTLAAHSRCVADLIVSVPASDLAGRQLPAVPALMGSSKWMCICALCGNMR